VRSFYFGQRIELDRKDDLYNRRFLKIWQRFFLAMLASLEFDPAPILRMQQY
jgi:hypothetical protein